MTHSSFDRETCLERARMHERLASTTRDSAARQMHHAMAAEFRRRAEQPGEDGGMQVPGPIVELRAAVG